MYNQPYFFPGYFPQSVAPSMVRGAMSGPAMRMGTRGALGGALGGARLGMQGARGLGLFSRLGSTIKAINWGGLITNTSKTLNVVNQTIPLVRQAGPMINNMKSVLKVASIFKDETDVKPTRQRKYSNVSSNNHGYTNKVNNTSKESNSTVVDSKDNNLEKEFRNDNSPTFFIN